MSASIAKTVTQRAIKPIKASHMQGAFTSHSTIPLVSSAASHHWKESGMSHVNKEHAYASVTHPQQEQQQGYYSSFDSTLDRVLEMTQLGQEQSVHWENVVRSAYQVDYQEDDDGESAAGGWSESGKDSYRESY